MSNPAMVSEVNRLIGCRLLSGQALSLPGIGSLLPDRAGAKRLSKRVVRPPYRTVAFTSQEQGLPLTEAIARVAKCDEAQAREIYDRWLSYAYADHVLTVEGVGVLKQKYFTLDPAFDRQLNPRGYASVRLHLRRRFDWALWSGIAAIVVAAGFGGRQLLLMQPDPGEIRSAAEYVMSSGPAASGASESAETPVEAIVPERSSGSDAAEGGAERLPADADPTDGSRVVSGSAAETDPATRTGTAVGERAANVVDKLVSGRRYVVLGVFSTEANAHRAVLEARKRVPGISVSVYPFGDKWMVSPLASDDAAACTRFVDQYGDRFPGLWVYTAR